MERPKEIIRVNEAIRRIEPEIQLSDQEAGNLEEREASRRSYALKHFVIALADGELELIAYDPKRHPDPWIVPKMTPREYLQGLGYFTLSAKARPIVVHLRTAEDRYIDLNRFDQWFAKEFGGEQNDLVDGTQLDALSPGHVGSLGSAETRNDQRSLSKGKVEARSGGPKARGRRPGYDWPKFREVALLTLEEHGAFDVSVGNGWNQAALERRMAEWCDKNWEKTPAESTVRDKVSEVADAYIKGRKGR